MQRMMIAGLIAATLAPAMASAQDRELRHDRQDIRDERHDVYRDRRDGAGRREIREDRRDVRDARRDYRGDWRDYRRSNPGAFRGSGYVGPRGYAYRPVSVGYRFQPEYYDRRYWVDAPRYRLPAPGRYERWVRYDRDVVRLDIRNGRTLQIIGGFFY